MSVPISTIALSHGDSIRLTCGEMVYLVKPNHEGTKLRFIAYHDDGDVTEEQIETETAQPVISVAAQRHRCSVQAIMGHDRRRHVMAAKREVVQVLNGKGWSLPMIGRVLGKHHTTVLHLLRTG